MGLCHVKNVCRIALVVFVCCKKRTDFFLCLWEKVLNCIVFYISLFFNLYYNLSLFFIGGLCILVW